jgi:uncharacterized repeat protein (TIGR01451 family)
MRITKAWGGVVALTGLTATVLATTGPVPAQASAPAAQAIHPAASQYQFPLPTINLVKSANVQSYAGAGVPITYTYDVTNDGDVALTGVTVTDPMAGLSAIDCGGGTNVIAELGTGSSQDCTATYTTTQADATAGSIVNVGTVTGTTPANATVSYNSSLTIAETKGPINCQKTSEYFLSEAGAGPPETLYYSYTPPGPYTGFTPVYNHKYNAIGFGYNGTYQGYVYAMVKLGGQIKLLKFGGGGYLVPGYPMSITGYPTGVPQPLVGSFDASGNYWVAQHPTSGGAATTAYEIDVNTSPPSVINSYALSPAFQPADWTYSQNYLWGMLGHTMYRAGPIPTSGPIPVSSWTVPVVSGYTFPPGTYGAAWTYANGNLGFSNNGTGKIFQIAVSSPSSPTPTLTEVPPPFAGPNSTTPNNDGTDCLGENAHLGVTGSGQATVTAGSAVSWNLTVTDDGPGDSSGFVLDDATTGGITGLTTTTPGCSVEKTSVDCAEASLDNGDSYTVTLSGTAPATVGKCMTTTATVTGNEADPDPGDNTASVRTCTTSGSGPSWTVKPGGKFSGKSGKLTITDAATNSVVTCTSSALTGTLQSGTGLSGTGLGSVTGLSLGNCTGPLGLTFNGTSNALPWALNAASYSGGVTSGAVTGVDVTLSGTGCTATLDGTAAGADNGQLGVSYANASHQLAGLTSGDALAFYNVTGCSGLFNTGDPATVSGTYTITPAQTITSP